MTQTQELSLVQLKILSKFIQEPKLRYSEGKPPKISNDLYKYHLKFLTEKRLLKKDDNFYSLTEDGKRIAQNLDVFGNPQKLFKVSVLVYLTRTKNGIKELLMQKRLRHPYYGDIETVSGKIKPGESPEEAGLRKLKEETGLSAKIKFVGIIRKIRKNKDGIVFEDTLYHVCTGSNLNGELIAKNEFGENFWAYINEAKRLVEKNKTFGKKTKEIIDKAFEENDKLFYFTEETTVN